MGYVSRDVSEPFQWIFQNKSEAKGKIKKKRCEKWQGPHICLGATSLMKISEIQQSLGWQSHRDRLQFIITLSPLPSRFLKKKNLHFLLWLWRSRAIWVASPRRLNLWHASSKQTPSLFPNEKPGQLCFPFVFFYSVALFSVYFVLFFVLLWHGGGF